MKTHKLKCWSPYFEAILSGFKSFEVRKDDRGYAVNDLLQLREWNDDVYTGREVRMQIIYIMDGGMFGIEAGYCMLGIRRAR